MSAPVHAPQVARSSEIARSPLEAAPRDLPRSSDLFQSHLDCHRNLYQGTSLDIAIPQSQLSRFRARLLGATSARWHFPQTAQYGRSDSVAFSVPSGESEVRWPYGPGCRAIGARPCPYFRLRPALD